MLDPGPIMAFSKDGARYRFDSLRLQAVVRDVVDALPDEVFGSHRIQVIHGPASLPTAFGHQQADQILSADLALRLDLGDDQTASAVGIGLGTSIALDAHLLFQLLDCLVQSFGVLNLTAFGQQQELTNQSAFAFGILGSHLQDLAHISAIQVLQILHALNGNHDRTESW